MDIWKTLNIQPTKDILVIDAAYAETVKHVDREVETARFERIRQAYEYALDYANTSYSFDAEMEFGSGKNAASGSVSSSGHTATVFNTPAEPLPSNVVQFDGPFRKADSAPAKFSNPSDDVQRLYELVNRDQKEAVVLLRHLLSSPNYATSASREKLEKDVLCLLYKIEPFPYDFASETELMFDWNIYDNPFKNNYELGFVFTSVLRKIARQRAREHISIFYFRNKDAQHPAWKDVEKVLFSPFNEANLIQLVEGSREIDGAAFILDYIESQQYHPDEHPVYFQTMDWWQKNKLRLTNFGSRPSVNRKKRASYIVLAVIFIAVIVQAIVFNIGNKDTRVDVVQTGIESPDKKPEGESAAIAIGPDDIAVQADQTTRPVVTETAVVMTQEDDATVKTSATSEQTAAIEPPSVESPPVENPLSEPPLADATTGTTTDTQQALVPAMNDTETVAARAPATEPALASSTEPAAKAQNNTKPILNEPAASAATPTHVTAAPTAQKTLPDIKEIKLAFAQKKYITTRKLAEPRAAAGDVTAITMLADIYANGYGVNKNSTIAAAYYKQAAQLGDAEAQLKLAFLYKDGIGVGKDSAKSFYWFDKAAKQAHPMAQYRLAVIYKKGQGATRDYQKAFDYFSLSAKQGNLAAQSGLGLMYRDGLGVKKDHAAALDWFMQAANKGHAKAQVYLALMYAQGNGVKRNTNKAIFWFEKAAGQGNVLAQSKLGQLYEYGGKDVKNMSLAIRWYKKAAKNGDRTATINLQRIQRKYNRATTVQATAFDEDDKVKTVSRSAATKWGEHAFEDGEEDGL